MIRIWTAGLLTAAGVALAASEAGAQVFVRAPFVRVQVGGPGVYVRAPFVNLYVPRTESYYVMPGPGQTYVAPPAELLPAPRKNGVELLPAPRRDPPTKDGVELLPAPRKDPPSKGGTELLPLPRKEPPPPKDLDLAPPKPIGASKAPTIAEFAKNFQAKAGSYEVLILSPVTKEPTPVRFMLPEGTPKRVNVGDRDIEFRYGPRQFVRIEFDKDGAIITSR